MSSTKGLVPSFNINPRHWLEMLREQLKEDAIARVSSASGQSPFREAEQNQPETHFSRDAFKDTQKTSTFDWSGGLWPRDDAAKYVRKASRENRRG